MPQQRGRSPSTGHVNQLRQSVSPSPQAGFTAQANALGVDPSLLSQPLMFPHNNMFSEDSSFFDKSLNQAATAQQLPFQSSSNQDFSSSQAYLQQSSFPQTSVGQSHGFQPNVAMSGMGFDSFDGYNGLDNLNDQYLNTASNPNLDPALFSDDTMSNVQQNGMNSFDSTNFFNGVGSQHHQSLPHNAYGQMSTQNMTSDSANLMSQSIYANQMHSHNNSLDPSSAAYPQYGQSNDFSGALFQAHRRTPSDARSDISSAHPSPYLGHADINEAFNRSSPMINGQGDAMFFNDATLNFGQFSLTDPHSDSRTPADSPIISPDANIQMQDTSYFSLDGLGMSNIDLGSGRPSGFGQQSHQDPEAFPTLQFNGNTETGYTEGTLSPPEINIEFAPPARAPTINEPNYTLFESTLSPPERSKFSELTNVFQVTKVILGQRRGRSSSAPYPPPKRDVSPVRGRSPSVGTTLTTNSPRPLSTSPVPNTSDTPSKRRSSNASNPDREYIINLARPQQSITPPTTVGEPVVSPTPSIEGGKRAQKHPANFACTLCDKRFTRAYNLRSHLRTHTDERPFICTVCGKAFARQHDRKRHEGLHTGERKFVCYGLLKESAGTWGCKRRFARADALGRHFRSEAGRACIRPLLDEEAAERQAALVDEANQNMMNGVSNGSMTAPITTTSGSALTTGSGVLDVSRMPLPAALLQMYPALADIQWNAQPLHHSGMDDGEYDAFDLSSGGEGGWDDEEGYLSGNCMGNGGGGQHQTAVNTHTNSNGW